MFSLFWNEPPSVLRNRTYWVSSISFYLITGETACLKEVNISGPDSGKFPNWIFLMTLQRTDYVNKQKYLCPDFSFFFLGIDSPRWPKTIDCWGFKITLRHTTRDSSGRVTDPSQRPLPDNTQHSQQTYIYAPSGIRTCNPGKQAAAEPRPGSRGHRDRHSGSLL
jgi:hypothetical protein